jgi:hypothetical protein
MKWKAVVTLWVLGLLGASVAFAAPPPGKGSGKTTTGMTTTAQGTKPPKTGVGCRPAVAVILRGTLTADGTAASISMKVDAGNRFARGFKTSGTATVNLTTTTKIIRSGKAAATDLKNADFVNVQARACKADLAHDATPTLYATRIAAHAPTS